MALELDDAHQTAVYIPFNQTDADQSYTLFPNRDLPNGYQLRMAAYQSAWSKCLQRVQELIHALHAPIVDRVAELVNKAYSDTIPGLPYTELPVIPVTVYGASSSIFDEISARLETEGQDGLFDTTNAHIVTNLFPQDCPNLASAMRTLISGFINENEEELDSVKRKPASSLSAVDINLLQTWFDALCESRGSDGKTTRLAIILHDFERFDPLIVQDLFEICSLSIPRLPLVFILSITSPPTPSYIHATYPRSALARLQIRSCSFLTSQRVLHDILLKTFFDVDFDPDIMIGPAALEFLVDFFGRHSPSLDGLVSILQLAHMKHFEEPLTVFATQKSLESVASASDDANSFFDSVLVRVQSSLLVQDQHDDWLAQDIDVLLKLVQTAQAGFHKHAKSLRVCFRVFLLVQDYMASLGHKGEKTLAEQMCAVLRGRHGTSYRYLCAQVKKLNNRQLDTLLSDLCEFFEAISTPVQKEERDIISRINTARLVDGGNGSRGIPEAIGDWLLAYFDRRFVALEGLPLWDIWYTGSTPFPCELLNPSLRASIFCGLLYPQEYQDTPMPNNGVDIDEETLWKMPDTSILFQRYLESGKMINVFDWFESFSVVLEAQKQHARTEDSAREALPRTPSKRKGKRRQVEDDRSPEESEEELEKWRMEVQARFVRALHELDYVGLIKHTGRKADHVIRTVFDVPTN